MISKRSHLLTNYSEQGKILDKTFKFGITLDNTNPANKKQINFSGGGKEGDNIQTKGGN